MRPLLLYLLLFISSQALANDNPLKEFRNFWGFRIAFHASNTTKLPSFTFSMKANGTGLYQVRIDVVSSLPSDLPTFITKNGSQVGIQITKLATGALKTFDSKQPDFEISVKVLSSTTFAETLDFLLDQVLQQPPQHLAELSLLVEDWQSVLAVLLPRQLKADFLSTRYFEEEKLLQLIRSTEPKKLWITPTKTGNNNLSDAFFTDSIVQNLEEFMVAHSAGSGTITSQLSDETLVKLRAVNVLLAAAPKLTLAGARRFLQPALEGKMDLRYLKFGASFTFDEAAFLEGLNVRKLTTPVETHWTGVDGPPKRIVYAPYNGNVISLVVRGK